MGKRAQREATRFDFAAQRRDMVEHHIAARGVRSESVLRAMRAVRREEFLPSNLREFAYEDSPLPIASGQTISQPYIVAFMIEALLLKVARTFSKSVQARGMQQLSSATHLRSHKEAREPSRR